ncbi:conjugal transfer protein TraH [Fastidiosibacter lacustris]|uniref:conjugal transfer protein TraH n=1 Tax=Fastidiosibacter lacustris TaxID=2056695 RepID=UPI0013009D1F|nr:conjugal transfer protein TraH [Fastidiosibacter lacustris]
MIILSKLFYRFYTFYKQIKRKRSNHFVIVLIALMRWSILSFTMSHLAYASFAESLNTYANEIGYANVTGATAAMTQSGGHFSAGSGYIATPVKQIQLAHVQMPNISASCSGIDWTVGGMSFINSEKLTQFGQAIVQSAVPFSIDLALQTWAPQIAALKGKFEAIANAINNLNISSCQAAQLAVGAVSGSFMEGKGKEYLCQSYKAQNSRASGWLASQQGCSNTADAAAANQAAKNDPNLDHLIKQDRNIVWYQLMKNDFLQKNPEVAEYLMSMTGTIIYPPIDSSGQMKPDRRSPLMIDSKTAGFNELLFGTSTNSKIDVYRCDDRNQEKCRNPSTVKLNIPKNKALVPKITTILESMGQKFINDTKLSSEEENLINAVNFPLLAIIHAEIRAGWVPEYNLYADIVSRIVLSSYIGQIIHQAMAAIIHNPSASSDEDFKWIRENLQNAQRLIVGQYQTQAYRALQQKSEMVMRGIQVQHSVVGDLSAQTKQNYAFTTF